MTIIATLKRTYNHPKKLQGMATNVGLAFSVGDTILRFTISRE